MTRVNADGSPDPVFGTQSIDFRGIVDGAWSIARQPDGRLVVAGFTSGAGGQNAALARLQANGQLDTSFAPGGSASDLDPASGRLEIDYGGSDDAHDILVQPDGKIVVAGAGGPSTFAVTRVDENGLPDAGFGLRLISFSGASDSAETVARLPDGRLLVAGETSGGGASNLAVALLQSGGALDPSFSPGGVDGDGQREIFLGGSGAARDALVQPDGKIVLAGSGYPGGDVVVVRLNADGSDDPSFDGDGIVRVDLGSAFDLGAAVALQADGKIVVAGSTGIPGSHAVVRLQPGGGLDTTFSGDGKQVFGFPGGGSGAFALALQPDGGLVTAGFVATNSQDLALARLAGDPVAGGGPGAGPGAGGPGAPPRCGGKVATIVGTPGKDRLRGTRRADVIVALGGNDTVAAGAGADLVCGGGGSDRLGGGAGKDRLLGGAGRDRLAGGPGLDRLLGQAGRDTLLGGPGRDVCLGGPGRDRATCERGS